MAATVEESTPPDMAMAMVFLGIMGRLVANDCFIVNWRQFPQPRNRCRD